MKFIRDIIGEKRQMTEQASGVAVANGSSRLFADDVAPEDKKPSYAKPDLSEGPMVLTPDEQVQSEFASESFDEDTDHPFDEDIDHQTVEDMDFDDILAGLSESGDSNGHDREPAATALRPAGTDAPQATPEVETADADMSLDAPEVMEERANRAPDLSAPDADLGRASGAFALPDRDTTDDATALFDFDALTTQEPSEAEAPEEPAEDAPSNAIADAEAPADAETVAPTAVPAATDAPTVIDPPAAEEVPTDVQPVDVSRVAVGIGASRQGRVKTRLLGFNAGNDTDADPMAGPAQATAAAFTKFPVGWLIVVSGPGRGSAFTLFNGVSQIGRGKDQTVALDFGDNSISRENHAAIAFDALQKSFFVGHGGKANLVRRNDRPVLSTEELSAGDTITIGETTLRFVPLCGPDFTWDNTDESEWAHAANS